MQKEPPIITKQRSQKSQDGFFAGACQPSFFKPFIQSKLTVNQPNDIYEREADDVASTVMRMSDHESRPQLFFKPAISTIQRKCDCEEDEKLKRKENEQVAEGP